MPHIGANIFISYRRKTAWALARLIHDRLIELGHTVFLDVESVRAGRFPTIIHDRIIGCSHFLLILTPGTLEGCVNPDDWVRREVELAIQHQRNIVPILTSDFKFDDYREYLSGDLASIHEYGGIPIYPEFFNEAITRLHKDYLTDLLSATDDNTLHSPDYFRGNSEEVFSHSSAQAMEMDAEHHWINGYCYVAEGDLDNAIAEFTQALSLNPEFVDAFVDRGVVYLFFKGDADRAINDLSTAIELDSELSRAHNNLGTAYGFKHQYETAIKYYTKALDLNPENYMAFNNRGVVYFQLGDLQMARADFDAAIEQNSSSYAEVYGNRGSLFHEQDKLEDALADYDRAIDIYPHAGFYNGRGLIYKQKLDFARAISDFTQAIALDEDFVIAYANRTPVYHLVGKYDEAVSDFSKYLEINADDIDIYHGRAGTHFMNGDIDLAIADWSKVINLDPNNYEAYYSRGGAYRIKGLFDKALDDLDNALNLGPKNFDVFNERGLTYLATKQYERAIKDFEFAITCDSSIKYIAYYNIGLVKMNQRDFRDAGKHFTNAIKLNWEDPDNYLQRALAYQGLGKVNKAVQDLKQYLRRGGLKVHGEIGDIEELIRELKRKSAN